MGSNAGSPGDAVSGKLGAVMFGGGALAIVLSLLAPHSAAVEEVPFIWLAVVDLAIAVLLLKLPQTTAPRVIAGITVGAGIAVICAAIYLNGERNGGPPSFSELYFIWPAFYVGYFLTPRAIGASLTLAAASYAGTLALMDVALAPASTRWIQTVMVATGVALATRMLRRHIDRLMRQLHAVARTDALTGLLNRRGFDEQFADVLDRAARTGEPLALLLGDVDCFKQLNDEFGHEAGDDALAAVGRVLAAEAAAGEVPARVGGEEFAVILPGCDGPSAVATADRLREAVNGVEDGGGRPLTISFGVVAYPRDGESPSDLLRAADRALYAAKAAGRDRAMAFAALPEPV